MSDTILFPTVVLKSFARTSAGGHAVFTSTYPKSIGDAMGWQGMPHGALSAKLEGKLHATHAKLEPKEGPLSTWQIEMDLTEISDFQLFRLELEGHKGKGHRIELRFKIGFADTSACRYLEEYMTHAGEAKASLTVSYVKQTEMFDRQISDEQAKDTSEDAD